jgi:hypothetical protein
MRILAAAVVNSCLAVSAACATDVQIGSQTIKVPAPVGTCEILGVTRGSIGGNLSRWNFLASSKRPGKSVLYRASPKQYVGVILVAKVSLVTTIRDKLVFIYNASRYQGPSTIATSLANLKIIYNDLVAANAK